MQAPPRVARAIESQIKDLQQSMRPLSRLIKFFAKYPPSQYSVAATGQAIPTTRQRREMDGKPLSATNVPQATSIPSIKNIGNSKFISMIPEEGEEDYEIESSTSRGLPPNPFLPYKNPETGRWRGARVGLRQQADLCRFAREHGVEQLLPASIKSSEFKHRRILERGLAVRGTGEGQRVKGHKWERTKSTVLDKRRKAMEGMPEMIRDWEQRGHGRGWKKYPK